VYARIMETEWQERFNVVAKCVYSVVLDADNKMTELKEHLFATGKIDKFQFKTWPRADRVSDAKAYVLDACTMRLCDMTNEVINSDYEPIVERSTVPVQFKNIKKCIEEMLVHVVSVEEEYNLDYMLLKTSMETAVTRLETYLLEE
jgi:hypothetical protein